MGVVTELQGLPSRAGRRRAWPARLERLAFGRCTSRQERGHSDGSAQGRRTALSAVHGLGVAHGRRTPDRRPGVRLALDVGPPVSHRRRLARPHLRGLHDARRLGRGHPEGDARPDGRRQHLPQPGAGGEDGHDPRPHERRPRDPGHRRRLVRDGARGLRDRLRLGLRRAPRLAGRGGGPDAPDAPQGRGTAAAASTTRRTSATTRRRSRSTCRS